MIKAKLYKGQRLKGRWDITLKLDGVRALFNNGVVMSRAGKPLYNIPTNHQYTDCEIYLGTFKSTIQAVRTQTYMDVPLDAIYSLDPLDERLRVASLSDPTPAEVEHHFRQALSDGHEGLVLRQGDKWLKVKEELTYDVEVTGKIEGTGRNEGRLGALMTTRGKVGTGFSDADRELLWTRPMEGEVIEVACMELTEDGKFRHPRFNHVREDKDTTMVN